MKTLLHNRLLIDINWWNKMECAVESENDMKWRKGIEKKRSSGNSIKNSTKVIIRV